MRFIDWVKKKGKKLVSIKNKDPYDAPDLIANRHDSQNIGLGFCSISMVNGHAGTSIDYYAALSQVIVHNYAVRGWRHHSGVYRINIPQDLTSKNEIISFLIKEKPALSRILPELDEISPEKVSQASPEK